MRRFLIALMVLALLPTVDAHAAPSILDVEVEAISDETNGASYVTDGYDLEALHVRAVHWRQAGTDGLMFRITASGGAVTPAAGERAIEFDVTVDGSSDTYRFTTTDDEDWAGDLDVVEQNNGRGDQNEAIANIQVFLPTPGIADGAMIGDFAMRSYVGDQLVDAAPGGQFVAGNEIPDSGGATIAEPFPWAGTIGYTETTVTRNAEGATLDVANLITVSGQHVTARVGDAEGWGASIVGDLAASIDAGEDLQFDLRITQVGQEPLVIEILTDIGGRELVVLPGQVDDPEQPLPPGQEIPDEPVEEESPAPAIGLLLAGLLLARRLR